MQMARAGIQVTAVVVDATHEASRFIGVDKTQPSLGMPAHDIVDVSARVGDVAPFMAQVQETRLILHGDVVGSDQPVEVGARFDTELADLAGEDGAEPGFEPLGIVAESVVNLTAVAP